MRNTAIEALAVLGPLMVPILASSEVARPRGVGPEFAKFYKSSDSFSCISNPSITLSFSQVNDDYCDCPDGSDEPGTAACAFLASAYPAVEVMPNAADPKYNATLALPGFYCKNKGHQPSYLPFSNVNDGICDYDLCCDGSDEWEHVGGVKCEDKCKEIGKEWRKQNDARQKSLGAANRKRKELVIEGARLKKEVEDRIKTLNTEIEASEIKVANLKKEVAEVERRERGKVVKTAGGVGKLSMLANLAKDRVNELSESLIKVRQQRDTMKGRVSELEEILSAFKEEYNPNFNDEGVKRAVKRWEDYAARDKGAEEDAFERDLEQIIKPDAENGLNWEDYEGQDDAQSDTDVLYKFEEYLPKPLRDWIDGLLRDFRVFLVDNGILAATPSDGNEAPAVTEARSRLTQAENSLNDQRNELTKHNTDLDADYGTDGVFRALKGRCITRDSGEYTYELCWMDRTTQKPKKGGGDTGMGNFVRFDTITVDDDVPADGRGLGSGVRYVMKYENGQHCWNGPSRSTTVVMACAETDEIWKIAEEEKCVYRMEVGTPAVCDNGTGQQQPKRDEL